MAARATVRTIARLGWTAALVGLAVLVVAASASAKGPPSGKGGPPPWAGGSGGSGGGKPGGGPPPWAGGAGKSAAAEKAKGAAKKAEKGLRKAEKKAAKSRERAEGNPAFTCFALIGELGEEFYETYGTNPNKANAFGKCVSEHAREQGEGGDEPAGDETAGCEEPAEGEEPAGEEAPLVELASLDEPEPAPSEGACDPAGEGTDDGSEETEGGEGGEPEPEAATGGADETETGLRCFLPLAARANPFAVCVRA